MWALLQWLQKNLVWSIPGAMALGTATRRWLMARHGEAAFKQRLAPRFAPLSTLGVLGIVAVSLALKANDILAHPAQLPAPPVPKQPC